MASLTIRNLDDDVRDRLRVRAAQHGRSMEAEVRAILTESLDSGAPTRLGSRIHRRFVGSAVDHLEVLDRSEVPRAAMLPE